MGSRVCLCSPHPLCLLSGLVKQVKELRGDKLKSTQGKEAFSQQETTSACDVRHQSPGDIHTVTKSPRGTKIGPLPSGTVHTGLGLSPPTAAPSGQREALN